MNRRQLPVFILSITLAVILFSCKKDNNASLSSFYGKWKTSYGDTVTFERQNGKNVIYYLHWGSPGPGPGPNDVREFNYLLGKLMLKDTPSSSFRALQTFAWIQEGHVFTVGNVELFPFMSSISTYTFTKIP